MSGIPQTYLMAVFLFGADNSSNSSEQLLQGWEMLAGGGAGSWGEDGAARIHHRPPSHCLSAPQE